MPRLDPAALRHPLHLLRTRAPWTALVYLVLEALAGIVSIGSWFTILLIPAWLLTWPRLEQRLLPLAGRASPRVIRRRGEMRWQDIVLVLLTAVMAVAAFFVGIVVVVLLGTLFATPVAVLSGRDVTLGNADQVLPAVPAALVAPVLGLAVLALVLWGATALAYGWSGLSLALLRDEESRLAAQVEALGDMSVQREDVVALERRALERDLHDGAQMHLSAAGLRLALLQLDAEQLPAGGPQDRVLAGLDEVREQLDLGGQSVRDAARGLVPTVLRDGGLEAALEELARALPLKTELECTVPRLPEAVEHGVHLIAREALTNIVRHSGAEHVLIHGTLTSGSADDTAPTLLLEITDDGHGGAAPTGTGLISMRARARNLGGTLDLDSPDGGPTMLRLQVPANTGGGEGR
ncbi:sensor histidine kinase [Brachybacterium sp. FME24]|uniref:sensor histidine kinase n=1 Tax=Brachybacterium sp. FME24 TaxID=2742605 RepID=UPI0018691A9A|nr:histidine kinase [Brachybacterium sp. FME24]